MPVESVRGRYGGYRLARGYRLPPLMLTDDEALAVLLGLVAGGRSGAPTTTGTGRATAAAKIRRVLPERLLRTVEAVLDAMTFTAAGSDPDAVDPAVLLHVADAVRRHVPLGLDHTDRHGRRGQRTLHPYGLVVHSGRWYVIGADPAVGEDRTLRLDRITHLRTLPGSFEPPADLDAPARVLEGFAGARYRHEVILRLHGTVGQLRGQLPPAVAVVEPPSATGSTAPDLRLWRRVRINAESLDWLPGTLAALDLPFVVEQPEELRTLVAALAERLAASARRTTPDE